jgi:hypothetical protein
VPYSRDKLYVVQPLGALEALPEDMAAPDRPYVAEAEAAAFQAVLEHRELAVLRGHDFGSGRWRSARTHAPRLGLR